MLDDALLQKNVLAELSWEPAVNAAHIGVAVANGVVTLSGQVKSYTEKRAAEEAVRRVKGVTGVAEELGVELPVEDQRTDEDIAHGIVNVLRWHAGMPLDAISVTVEQGYVALRGEVEWQYQRTLAEYDARHVRGVRGVRNLITLNPKSPRTDIEQCIAEAFRRSAEVDAANIKVTEKDGVVTLSGHVQSWHERQAAEQAAWAAPGVARVDDEITLSN